jgi:hypothetical protein
MSTTLAKHNLPSNIATLPTPIMQSPLNTTRSAVELVDLTYGNWSYYEEFPSLEDVINSSKSLPKIPSPPQLASPFHLTSPTSDRTIPASPFSPDSHFVAMDLSDDFQSPVATKKRHVVIIETPPQQTKKIKSSNKNNNSHQKPRLQWTFEQRFQMHEEQEALQLIHSLAPPGSKLSKNQPYQTKGGIIQCYRCSEARRACCTFKAKVVYDELEKIIEVYSNGEHDHSVF